MVIFMLNKLISCKGWFCFVWVFVGWKLSNMKLVVKNRKREKGEVGNLKFIYNGFVKYLVWEKYKRSSEVW